jgi:hypothetical protein
MGFSIDEAGVKKIVHISVTQASVESDLPYYRGKAQQEQALMDSGVPYSIVRPTLVFGKEDILVNNIGWLIRKSPVFPIFGSGGYKVQPVFVEDLASLLSHPLGIRECHPDAIGPETLPRSLSSRSLQQGSPGEVGACSHRLGILLGRIIGIGLGDVVLTRRVERTDGRVVDLQPGPQRNDSLFRLAGVERGRAGQQLFIGDKKTFQVETRRLIRGDRRKDQYTLKGERFRLSADIIIYRHLFTGQHHA